MKLSIIIPAYNAALTINRLIDSIVSQVNYHFHIEVVIINDGSTDTSKEVLNMIAITYDFIHVYHIKNIGVSKVRNLALTKITGDYIWMLDADDYITANAFETVENNLKEAVDVLHFGYFLENSNGVIQEKLPPYTKKTIDGITFLERNDGRLYFWNNIYNAVFLDSNSEIIKQLFSTEKFYILEDTLFNFNLYPKAKQVKYINAALYTYTHQENSISKKKNLAHLLNMGTSSYNVHKGMKFVMDSFPKDSKAFLVLKKRLSLSVLGFFYSLLIERYPLGYIKKMYQLYLKENMLPVDTIDGSFKVKAFKYVVNRKTGYMLFVQLHLFRKGAIS